MCDANKQHQDQGCGKILNLAQNLAEFKASSPYRPQQVSRTLLEYANFSEEQISWIISELFKYKELGKYPLLQYFLNCYFPERGLTAVHPMVMTEYSEIDVCVIDDNYVIIFENKIKGATFQHNQMARYIHWAETYLGKKEILTVIFSSTDCMGNISTWRFPTHGFESCKSNNNIQCNCDIQNKDVNENVCKDCLNYGNHKERTVLLNENFTEWVKAACEIVPSREYRMKSMMVQFADYLDSLFNTTDTNAKLFNMEIRKYIERNVLEGKTGLDTLNVLSQKINEINDLSGALTNIKYETMKDFIDNHYHRMETDYKQYAPSHCLTQKKCVCGIYIPYNSTSLYVYICLAKEKNNDIYSPAYGLYIEGATEEETNEINSKLPNGMALAYWDKQSQGSQQISSEEKVYDDFETLAETFISLVK